MICAVTTNDRLSQLVDRFGRNMRPVRLRPISDWAEAEVRLPSGPWEGRRYRIDRLPYAQLLLPELGKWRRHVITGPTQGGKTLHAFVLIIMYYLFEVKEDVIVGLPDLSMAGVKWEKDIKPVIARSSYRNQMPSRGPASQGGKPSLVTFRNGRSLHFMAGGGGDKQRAGATSRVLAITETDGLAEVSATSKEGQDKVSQLEGRVRSHGLDSLIFMECTVTTKNGRTWSEYQQGTQSRIACQCPHCHHWVSPEREHFVGWDTAETKIEAGERAAFSCPDCGVLYTEDERHDMNVGAKLVHRGQEVTPDGEIVGDPPKTDTFGFRWSAFNNLLSPASLIGMEEWQAENGEDLTAQVVLKQQVWCVPAEDSAVEREPLSISIVRGSAPGYHGRCNGRPMWDAPEWTEFVVAQVDVGKRVLDWVVCAFGSGLRDVIAYGATPTERPDVIGPEEAILAGLHSVRNEIELHCELTLGLVDCRYQGNRKQDSPRRVVYEFTLACGSQWMPSLGLSAWFPKEQTDDIEPSLTGDPWYLSRQYYLDQSVWVVDFDPNHFKHLSHGSYVVRPLNDQDERIPGSVTLFGDTPKEHNPFAEQLNNERFEIDHQTGRAEWKRHGPNHKFDCDVGTIVASSVVDSLVIARTQAKDTQGRARTAQVSTPDGRPFFVGNR